MIKNIICFVLGAAVGGLTGYFIGKKIEEEKCEKQVEELKEYYKAKDRYIRYNTSDDENKDTDAGEQRENGMLSAEKRDEIRKKLNKNWSETTNYASCYGHDKDEDQENTPEMEANNFHDQNRNRPPELISETALYDVPGHFEHQLLYYYAFDETVTDEDECMIDEPGHLLGMVMEDSGFIDDDTMQIYVINYQTDCVYEVNKILASYCETHEIVMSEK